MKDYIETVTQKLEIAGSDLYVHAGWDERGILRYLDLRLAFGCDGNVRAALEIIVDHAKSLVDAGVWTVDQMKAKWRGTRMDPNGICPQVRGIVSSPLDAAARFIEMKEQEFSEKHVREQAEQAKRIATEGV